MKYLILYLLLFSTVSCYNTRIRDIKPSFEFNGWRKSVLILYDSLTSDDNSTKYRRYTNIQMEQKEINYVSHDEFVAILNYAVQKNTIKNWSKMYVIYHYISGEVNINITSIIFIKGRKCYGISHCHNNGKKYEIPEVSESVLKNIPNALHSGNSGLAIISKFNRKYINLSNKIVTGVSYSEELEPLMKIYDDKIFD